MNKYLTLLFKQFTTFSIVGAVGTAVHFALLIISVRVFNLDPVFGSVIGFIAAVTCNYLLNYHFTFKSDRHHLETSVRFCAVALVGLAINTIIMFLLTHWLHYLVSQAFAAAIVLLWNFLCNRFWTFREAKLVKQ